MSPNLGDTMLRIDGAYLYDFGSEMNRIASLKDEDTTALDIYFHCSAAKSALQNMVYTSVFSDGFRTVHKSATDLLAVIDEHSADLMDRETYDKKVHDWQVRRIKGKLKDFEAIIRAELQTLALYYVSPKGGFDNRNLVDSGAQLFPASLESKVPEACPDVTTGARCMAFELWTAMAFHFHRANEAVLRRYYASVIGTAKQPKNLTMGTMLSSMEQHDVGDVNIRAALKNIVVFHRNPIAHPDHHISSSEEAISLYASVRAAMGFMLERLPESVPIALAARPSVMTAATSAP